LNILLNMKNQVVYLAIVEFILIIIGAIIIFSGIEHSYWYFAIVVLVMISLFPMVLGRNQYATRIEKKKPILTIYGISIVIMLLFYILAIVLKGYLGSVLVLIGTLIYLIGIAIDVILKHKRLRGSK
jgi:hypothetical protein